jgi:hypothetical protein
MKSADGWPYAFRTSSIVEFQLIPFGRLSAEHADLTTPLLVVIEIDRVDFIICTVQ